MKVFISGSKISNNVLPESVRSYLDDIMAEGTEILIGDCMGTDTKVQEYLFEQKYKRVTVYVSGGQEKTRSNLGHWEEIWFHSNGSAPYVFRVEKDFHMAEDCDCGVAIWDGKSKGTFINMLCLCALKKACKLWLTQEARWMDVASLEDIRGFAGSEGKISNEDVRNVLLDCGFSNEMTEFLALRNVISPFILIDIISSAPIPLDRKSFWFARLGSRRNLKAEAFASVEENMRLGMDFTDIKYDIRALVDPWWGRSIWTELYQRSMEIQDAKKGLHLISGKIFDNMPLVLFSEWYDVDELQLKSASCGVFVGTGAVKRYIRNEEYDNDTDDIYYRMEAWDAYDNKWENPRYDYYFYRGEICWFDKLIPEKYGNGNTYYLPQNRDFSSGRYDLNFLTPYKPGDIVLIDCRPFGAPFHAMILEARHQWDCCLPNIVFQYPGTSEWSLTPLKHRSFYKDIGLHTYETMLSPLYRLRKVNEEEMTEEDEHLLELSKIISGSEEKAAKVWENWRPSRKLSKIESLSWEEVLEVFATIR